MIRSTYAPRPPDAMPYTFLVAQRQGQALRSALGNVVVVNYRSYDRYVGASDTRWGDGWMDGPCAELQAR